MFASDQYKGSIKCTCIVLDVDFEGWHSKRMQIGVSNIKFHMKMAKHFQNVNFITSEV